MVLHPGPHSIQLQLELLEAGRGSSISRSSFFLSQTRSFGCSSGSFGLGIVVIVIIMVLVLVALAVRALLALAASLSRCSCSRYGSGIIEGGGVQLEVGHFGIFHRKMVAGLLGIPERAGIITITVTP